MDNIQTRQESSKKKLLVPVVVLILLAVGFTGAAYAYSTSVTTGGSHLDADYLTIDLNGGSKTSENVLPGDALITFTDNYTYGDSKLDVVKYTIASEAVVAKIVVKVTGETGTEYNKFNVEADDLGDIVLCTVSSDNKTVSDLFTLSYKVKTDSFEGTVVATEALGTASSLAETAEASASGTVYYVEIVATQINAAVDQVCDATSASAARATITGNAGAFDVTVSASYA